MPNVRVTRVYSRLPILPDLAEEMRRWDCKLNQAVTPAAGSPDGSDFAMRECWNRKHRRPAVHSRAE